MILNTISRSLPCTHFTGLLWHSKNRAVHHQSSNTLQGTDKGDIVQVAPAANQQAGRPGKKPPPPPTAMPPPKLPTKDDNVWQNCALLVDKPLQWTSNDVVVRLRRALDIRKIGHAGTLDPLATGLLVLCIGRGTKSSMLLTAEDKVYSGSLRLGEATPSYDAETAVTETAAWEHITEAHLQAAATTHFTGALMQLPPIFSAIQVKGKRMYEAARAGEDIERQPRAVKVLEFRVWQDAQASCRQSFRYWIRCGKGTYVRSLIHDLGEKVGSKAHVTELRRESSGKFDVTDAWQLHELLAVAQEMGLERPRREPQQRQKRRKREEPAAAAEAAPQSSQAPPCG